MGEEFRVRCKFRVKSITNHEWGGQDVRLEAVHGGTAENESFAEATPAGTLEFTVTNPAVRDLLLPGEEFYVDLTRATGPRPAA